MQGVHNKSRVVTGLITGAVSDEHQAESDYPARWWRMDEGGKLVCELCPRDCHLKEGQRGSCFVRRRQNDTMVLTTYGRSSGYCIDPIEKKPLLHFYPGSSVLSFGTAGCNLTCKFCQNWDISRSRDADRSMSTASPAMIANAAVNCGARSLAYTYNDPVIFAEYAIDTAAACRQAGINNVAVTAGYINPAARREFFAHMDAANVDLKSFDDSFYYRLCSAHLQPVLETLAYIKHETSCWLEITNLVIPGHNDSHAEMSALASWVYRELGADVPLHFSAFHPDWKMNSVQRTPAETLVMARQVAQDEGIRHVYAGNVLTPDGGCTFCPQCKTRLIDRAAYDITYYHLTANGHCPHCQWKIAGRFGRFEKAFGNQRIPIKIISE